MARRWIYIVVCWLSATCLSVWGQAPADMPTVRTEAVAEDTVDRLAEDFVLASCLVADPGEVLYSVLGHISIRLQCPTYGMDYCFSYESDNVESKVWTFLAGHLKMGMFAIPTEDYLAPYRAEGRGVREYTLYLSPVQKQELWRILDEAVMEGINLPYDFVERGCGISCFRLINQAAGPGAIRYTEWPEGIQGKTWRELYCSHLPIGSDWTRFITMMLVGSQVDKVLPPKESQIMPADVVETLQHAQIDGHPMLSSEYTQLLESRYAPQAIWYTPLLFAVLLLLAEIGTTIWSRRWRESRAARYTALAVDWLILLIEAAMGALMTYLIIFSDLPCTQWHWLLIPLNILPLLAWYWRRYWAKPYAAVLALWCIAMTVCNLWVHTLVDWAQIVFAIAFMIVLYKQNRITDKNIQR